MSNRELASKKHAVRKNNKLYIFLGLIAVLISAIVIISIVNPVLAQDIIYLPFVSTGNSNVTSAAVGENPTPTPEFGKPVPEPPVIPENPATKITELADRAPEIKQEDKATVIYLDKDGNKKGILVPFDKVQATIDSLAKDQTYFLTIPPLSLFGHRSPRNSLIITDSQIPVTTDEPVLDSRIPVPPTPPSFGQ